MIDDAEKKKRLEVVKRIAIAMADCRSDSILNMIEIRTMTTFEGHSKTEEELDCRHPVATQKDGGRYFQYVRMDGRGQLDIVWPSGIEKTIKFRIPEELLDGEIDTIHASSPSHRSANLKITSHSENSELEDALGRMKKLDPEFPL